MAYKPGSVPALRQGMAIPLGRLSPSASRDRPGWRCEDASGLDRHLAGQPSLLGLAPGGVCPATAVAGGAVRSYRTISPLPRRPKASVGGVFLWHCPWGRPRRPLAGTVFPWSPDFPRSARDGEARPSGHLAEPYKIARASRVKLPPRPARCAVVSRRRRCHRSARAGNAAGTRPAPVRCGGRARR